jgi:hypothetical protein
MSLDTIERIESRIEDEIESNYSRYVIYESLNEDLPDQGSGPFIKVFIEPDTDYLDGIATGEKMYTEFGSVVFQIFDEEGSGTRDLHTIATEIRDSMRDVLMYPTGSQEGTIHLQEYEERASAISIKSGGRNWKRKDVFVGYQKSYDV